MPPPRMASRSLQPVEMRRRALSMRIASTPLTKPVALSLRDASSSLSSFASEMPCGRGWGGGVNGGVPQCCSPLRPRAHLDREQALGWRHEDLAHRVQPRGLELRDVRHPDALRVEGGAEQRRSGLPQRLHAVGSPSTAGARPPQRPPPPPLWPRSPRRLPLLRASLLLPSAEEGGVGWGVGGGTA